MTELFNTGNPVPSADIKDRSDNTQKFDLAINAFEDFFIDRLGRTRVTWSGMEKLQSAAIAAAEQKINLFVGTVDSAVFLPFVR